jgi:hypothetical protein
MRAGWRDSTPMLLLAIVWWSLVAVVTWVAVIAIPFLMLGFGIAVVVWVLRALGVLPAA